MIAPQMMAKIFIKSRNSQKTKVRRVEYTNRFTFQRKPMNKDYRLIDV